MLALRVLINVVIRGIRKTLKEGVIVGLIFAVILFTVGGLFTDTSLQLVAHRTMTTEEVFSPIEDKGIKKNLNTSPIWKDCYKKDEQFPKVQMYRYVIKFDGLKPVQVLKVQKWRK